MAISIHELTEDLQTLAATIGTLKEKVTALSALATNALNPDFSDQDATIKNLNDQATASIADIDAVLPPVTEPVQE